MKPLWTFILLLIFGSFQESFGIRKFWRGRRFEAEPAEPKKLEGNEDLWFEQQLDHFDPTNSKTWKQVAHALYLSLIPKIY
jgi:hypothetical protein